MERVTVNIAGMTCGHCVRGVSQALSALDGVTVEDVQIGQAIVTFDPASASSEQIAEAIRDEGYEVVSTQ
ncbi:MAG TPA: cation transporter [Gemmatimonadaceae bacterium]|nr:cation transporter [Gemmatimonadaceae bacterium]